MSKITINGITLDPLVQAPALAAANLHAVDATASNYILIQTTQALSKDMKDELTNMGVVILEYVPDDTYLCHYPGTISARFARCLMWRGPTPTCKASKSPPPCSTYRLSKRLATRQPSTSKSNHAGHATRSARQASRPSDD